jgi:hypothetical protein
MEPMRPRLRWKGYRRVGGLVIVLAGAALLSELLVLGLRNHQLRSTTVAPTANPATSTASFPTTIWGPLPPPPLPTTTTFRPPVIKPDLVTYTFPAPTRVTLEASGDCWVEARPSANGKILSAVILIAGHKEAFMSPVWLRLGNPPNVQVTAGRMLLQVPSNGPGDPIVGTG